MPQIVPNIDKFQGIIKYHDKTFLSVTRVRGGLAPMTSSYRK